jgi:hypothetical protein
MMIAKRIAARAGGRGFGGLARYVVDAKGRSDPATWTRTADYILDTAHDGAKVNGVRVTNCGTDDPADATLAVLAVQDAYDHRPGRKSAASRSYHLVISFPPGEQPPAHVLRAVEDELVQVIGYGQHQRLSAVHNDTDHLHIHVAINKVHPVTLRNVEPYFDKRRLMEACEALELRHGLARTNHGVTRNRVDREDLTSDAMPERAAALEAHSGRESLTRWVRENVRSALLDATASGDWQALHAAADRFGLTVKQRGAGIVIVDDASGTAIKASDVDRALSAKSLVARLGPFQPRRPTATAGKPAARYQATMLPRQERSPALREAYQRQRADAVATRATARRTQAERHAAYVAELRKWYRQKSDHLKVRTDLGREAKRAAWQALFAERAADFARERTRYAAERQQASLATPVPTWRGFVAQAAASGDTQAAALLQRHQRRVDAAAANGIPLGNTSAPKPTVNPARGGSSTNAPQASATRKPGRHR